MGVAPLWSTLILPNAATVNRLVYATGANTWGDSANLIFDGTLLTITGNLKLTGTLGMGVTSAGSAGSIQWNATGDTGPSIVASATVLRFKGGTTDTEWYNQLNAAELMRLTDAGALLVGTATGGAAGAINAANGYYSGGTLGTSLTYTMCKTGACVTTCTIVTTGGIVTGGTCNP